MRSSSTSAAEKDPFLEVVRALTAARVRFVLIGVSGANYFAESAGAVFVTEDRDLFLPPDAKNALKAWRTLTRRGYQLAAGDEALGAPLDLFLARAIVERQALVRAEGHGVKLDLTLVMAGFDFETAYAERRVFRVKGVSIPVARLTHIVESKALAGRPKDRLFLATHEEALRELLSAPLPRRPRKRSRRPGRIRGRIIESTFIKIKRKPPRRMRRNP